MYVEANVANKLYMLLDDLFLQGSGLQQISLI